MLDKNKVKLGIAPIGWTNDDMPDLGCNNSFEQCISEMALAGYTGSEVGNKYPKDTVALNKALKLRGLTIANAWFSSFLVDQPYEVVEECFVAQAKFLKAVGATCIGASEQSGSIQGQLETPIFTAKRVLNDTEWKRLADGLNRLGEKANEIGLNLVFHHHMGTVVQTAQETDKLMEMTDPKLVSLLYDSGHFFYSGEDPVAMLEKYIKRVKHVHIKDVRPEVIKRVKDEGMSFLKGVRLGTFTVPGDGAIDFKPIFKILAAANYSGWILVEAEQDPFVANPFEYAVKARKYIKETAGI